MKKRPERAKVLFRDVEVVTRADWGAVDLDRDLRPGQLQLPVTHVFLAFTYTRPCYKQYKCVTLLQDIQRDHRDRYHLRDLKYNFLAGGDGRMYEGRGWYSTPVLPIEYHHLTPVSYLLAFVGDHSPSFKRNWPFRDIEENMLHVKRSFIKYGLNNKFIAKRFRVNHLYLCEVMIVDIYAREAWGAQPARYHKPLEGPANLIFLVFTYTRPCNTREECTREIQRLQMLHINIQQQNDIRYNFLIGGDGNVYEGRGWYGLPATPWTFKRSPSSFVLGFMGQYAPAEFPQNMKQAAIDLIDYGMDQGLIHQFSIKENRLRKVQVPDFNNISADFRSEPYNWAQEIR